MSSDMEREPLSTRWRADAVLVAVTVVWGADFVVVKNLLGAVAPLPFLFWRFLAATVLIGLVLPGRRRTPRLLRDGVRLGLLLSLGMGLQVLGQAETTASHASFLTGLASVFTPVAAFLTTRRLPTRRERPRHRAGRRRLRPHDASDLRRDESRRPPRLRLRGDLCLLHRRDGGAFRTARHGLVHGGPAGAHDRGRGIAAVVQGGAAALSAGIAPIASNRSLALQALALVVLGTAGTYVFQTWAQGHMSATHAAIIYTLEPVVTALLAALFLRERLGARGWAGGGLVLAGIVVSELRLRDG